MKPETRNRAREREVEKAFESWEMLLFNRLVEFDHFLESIQSDLAAAGLPLRKSGAYLTEKIVDMNEQIQQNKANRPKKAI